MLGETYIAFFNYVRGVICMLEVCLLTWLINNSYNNYVKLVSFYLINLINKGRGFNLLIKLFSCLCIIV